MATPLQRAADRVLARSEDRPGPLTTPCRIFLGALNRDGYGHVKAAGRNVGAHRAVYLARVGDPASCDVHHKCDTPACVNPDHLEALPRIDHVHLGGSPAARYALRDRCAHGHPLDGTHRRPAGTRPNRRCLTCHREEEARRRARLRGELAA